MALSGDLPYKHFVYATAGGMAATGGSAVYTKVASDASGRF
jgi:hypothetical protein